MPLVAAKCTECGGAAKVDSEKKAAICQSCGNAFIVEEAINYFNTQYFNTTNITNSVVHIHEDKNKDFKIVAGELKKYTGEAVEVVIPDTVIRIGENAFKETLIKSVVIPDSVLSIEDSAFFRCENLASIIISDGVESIGRNAFLGCKSLGDVTIPNSVANIENCAFYGCTSLENVRIPSNVSTINDGVFQDCSSLKSVTIPKNVKAIGNQAFLDCSSLMSITIPDGVESIGYSAFSGCSALRNVQISPELLERGVGRTSAFRETPFLEQERLRRGLCQRCGGKLSMFVGKCKSCGK